MSYNDSNYSLAMKSLKDTLHDITYEEKESKANALIQSIDLSFLSNIESSINEDLFWKLIDSIKSEQNMNVKSIALRIIVHENLSLNQIQDFITLFYKFRNEINTNEFLSAIDTYDYYDFHEWIICREVMISLGGDFFMKLKDNPDYFGSLSPEDMGGTKEGYFIDGLQYAYELKYGKMIDWDDDDVADWHMKIMDQMERTPRGEMIPEENRIELLPMCMKAQSIRLKGAQ